MLHAVRWVAVAVLVLVVATAGCTRPRADSAEPSRPSEVAGERVVDGEPLWHNGSVVVSPLPSELGPVLSPDAPMNCFYLTTDTGEPTFIGGAAFLFTWTPTVAATAELAVEVSNGPAGTFRAQGASPLELVATPSEDGFLALPLYVEVAAAAGPMEPMVEQDVSYSVQVGLLESLIDSLKAEPTRCT